MKPTTRIIDYAVLVQDGVLTTDDLPQDVKNEVIKWVQYFQGIKNSGVAKEQQPEAGKLVAQDDKSNN